MSEKEYWNEQYALRGEAHASQNWTIARDLLKALDEAKLNHLLTGRSCIEFGCGTGDLLAALVEMKEYNRVIGSDPSPDAIRIATARHGDDKIKWTAKSIFDLMDTKPDPFDVGVCSNVLEHFKNPWTPLDVMLSMVKRMLVIVPYDQPVTDGYESEGGAGHVYRFDESDFELRTDVLGRVKFQTNGWQCSTSALQMAVVLQGYADHGR